MLSFFMGQMLFLMAFPPFNGLCSFSNLDFDGIVTIFDRTLPVGLFASFKCLSMTVSDGELLLSA